MKKRILSFGMAILILSVGILVIGCDMGGGGGGGSKPTTPSNPTNFSWNGTYTGDGNVTISGNNKLTTPSNNNWPGTEIATGQTLDITIIDGGEIKAGSNSGAVIGRYSYINFGGARKGILVFAKVNGVDSYGLGLGNRSGDGAPGVVSFLTNEGAFFSPSVSYSGMSSSYSWMGIK